MPPWANDKSSPGPTFAAWPTARLFRPKKRKKKKKIAVRRHPARTAMYWLPRLPRLIGRAADADPGVEPPISCLRIVSRHQLRGVPLAPLKNEVAGGGERSPTLQGREISVPNFFLWPLDPRPRAVPVETHLQPLASTRPN